MSYHENWQEDRRRHKENHNNTQRWRAGKQRSGYRASGYWNNNEYASRRAENMRRSQDQNNKVELNKGEDRHRRNPHWDSNAPYSSRYDLNDYMLGNNESRLERDRPFEEREEERFLNRHYGSLGMTDPQYGDPRISDRQRLGSNGGSSDSYERWDYGNYPVYGSSGHRFSESPQDRFDTHILDWNSDDDYDPSNEISPRWKGHRNQVSHRGKGPKNYKRSDSRIKEDVCDALYDHHFVDASEIEVEVKDGNVILSGFVDNRYAKRDAETAIDYISGVENVENRIHVKPKSFNSNTEIRKQADNNSKTQLQSTSKK